MQDDYSEAFVGISSASMLDKALLDKALALGEITIIEYFLETSFYYNATNQYLEAEKCYHESIAKLLRHQL